MMATTSHTNEEKKLSTTADRLCRRFSLAEIQLATEDFSKARLIGEGGFGEVYRGLIDNGQLTVAIKQLASKSNQGTDEFFMEIETLSKVRHVNLVSLIGYCSENGEMILVLEYIACGTLIDHLCRPSGDNNGCLSLNWKQRLKTCIGAARGLEYLHTGCSIIHRDVKSTNILVDENFTAKVSDFGLAKHFSSFNSKSYVTTKMKGTLGYVDPSYAKTGRLTRKSDTYSFGVVLLEALYSRRAVNPTVTEDEMDEIDAIGLAEWAKEKIKKGKVDQIVASNLREEISADCLKTFVGVAKECLHPEPKKRPTMAQVVVQLEFALEQQERRPSILQQLLSRPLTAIWNIFKLYGNGATGSAEKDREKEDVFKLLTAIEEDAPKEEDPPKDKQTVNMLPIAISLHELKYMTNGFSSHCLLVVGPLERVYRGVLRSGQVALIKRFDCRILQEQEFLGQVLMLSNLKHENVAELLGYCFNGRQKFLAYEFGQKGSLHYFLLRQKLEPGWVLSWHQRVKIAVGVAKGLEYIHHKKLIHRNIDSSKVLLFDNEVVKIVDCGMSNQSPEEGLADYGDYHPSVFCHPRDYHPPEYVWHNILSWRTDVYGFGVVLLQLLTGCKAFDQTRQIGQRHIVTCVTPYLSEDKVLYIVDPMLQRYYPPEAAVQMAKIAAACVDRRAECRPKMSIVVRYLCLLLNAGSV